MPLKLGRGLGRALLSVIVASAIQLTAAQAAPVTTPVGLNPGDQYRLTFATSGLFPAISPSIADYNNFVTAAAGAVPQLAALGTVWHAMVILSSGDSDTPFLGGAHPGFGPGVPIYRLDGALVAATNNQLFSGALAAPILLDENGNAPVGPSVWTGISNLGGADFTLGPGFSTLGTFGNLTSTTTAFKAFGEGEAGLGLANWTGGLALHLYAVSEVLTVPGGGGTVAEPGQLALFGIGLAVLGFMRRRRAA